MTDEFKSQVQPNVFLWASTPRMADALHGARAVLHQLLPDGCEIMLVATVPSPEKAREIMALNAGRVVEDHLAAVEDAPAVVARSVILLTQGMTRERLVEFSAFLAEKMPGVMEQIAKTERDVAVPAGTRTS